MSDEPRWIDCKLFAERGYIVATEKRSMRDPMREPRPGEQFFIFRSAYSLAGGYIDDPKIAHRLWKRYGIVPELSKRTHKTCSIGYSVKKKRDHQTNMERKVDETLRLLRETKKP